CDWPRRLAAALRSCRARTDARAIASEAGTPLNIASDTYRLSSQTLLRTRAITPESAALLDGVLASPAVSADSAVVATGSLARRLSGPERRAIEERAMDAARMELERAGWTHIMSAPVEN
ncbi:MAG: hypothetical protein ABW167_10400, partial [Baekduia sp.]